MLHLTQFFPLSFGAHLETNQLTMGQLTSGQLTRFYIGFKNAGLMLAFGRDILTEFTLTDFKLRFILHFYENFNLEVNINTGTVVIRF